LRARCIGEYLDLCGSKKQLVGEKNGIMRRFIIFNFKKINSRRMRWVEHVACTGEIHVGFRSGILKG
jgi:hypothetical protein